MLILADYILIFIALGVGVVFAFLGANILYKFYLGIIIGFLLFLVFNSQIDLLENLYIRELNPFQNFLVKNKEFVLGSSILSIPLLGILSAANKSFSFNGKDNALLLLTFGMMLPFIFVALLSYIWENIYLPLDFIKQILQYFQNSFFYDFFSNHLSWILVGLLFMIFYRAFFLLLFAFIAYIYEVLRGEFGSEKKEESKEESEKVSSE